METLLLAPAPVLPANLDDLADGEILRMPATWDEYFDLAETTDYTIQYFDNHIILMSQATDIHEFLVARMIKLFAIYFDDLPGYRVIGSNVRIVIPDQAGDFQADLSVINGPSDYGLTKGGRVSTVRLKNPEVVVEVLSKGTQTFDLNDKFEAYQTVPTLNHILLVDQQTVSVRSCSRTDRPDQWLLTHHRALTDVVTLGGFELPLADLYRNLPVGPAPAGGVQG
jgi:Uma2 family endonuclease